MARAKKAEEVEAIEVEKVDMSIYQVFDAKGDFQRDYQEQFSGAGAKEMAEEFARSINGKVVTK